MSDPERCEVELTLHGYDWKYHEEDITFNGWCMNKQSQTTLLRINNFKLKSYIQLPDRNIAGESIKWSKGKVKEYMSALTFKALGHKRRGFIYKYIPKSSKVPLKISMYKSFEGGNFIEMSFDNKKIMQKIESTLKVALYVNREIGLVRANLREGNSGKITPIMKFITAMGIKFCGWFNCKAIKVPEHEKISRIEEEYYVRWEDVKRISSKISQAWSTNPKLFAWDIETYSHRILAFPDRNHPKDVAFMISCITQIGDKPDTRKRYGIILGDANHIPEDKLSNLTVIKVNTETELIEEFGKLMRDEMPNVELTFNGMSFDWTYLNQRLEISGGDWVNFSFLKEAEIKFHIMDWNSSGRGFNKGMYPIAEGIITMDMYQMIRLDFKDYEQYTLDNVSKKTLGKSKHDVKAQEMFYIYDHLEKYTKMLTRLKDRAIDYPELMKDEEFLKRFERVSKKFEFWKTEFTKVLEYCIQDSELVIELYDKLQFWVYYIELSNIVCVLPFEIYTRGQQIRCVSQIYRIAKKLGFVLEERDLPVYSFEGGFVFDPVPGVYRNIVCLDFSSLYPSIIMAYNMCYTTLINEMKYGRRVDQLIKDTGGTDEDNDIVHTVEFDQRELIADPNEEKEDDVDKILRGESGAKKVKKTDQNTQKVHHRYRFWKQKYNPDGTVEGEGLIPQLVRKLVEKRRAITKVIIPPMEACIAAYESIRDNKEFTEDHEALLTSLLDRKKYWEDVDAERITRKKIEPKRLTDIDNNLIYYLTCLKDRKKLDELDKELIKLIAVIKFMLNVLNKRQSGIKVSANSWYGFLGVRTNVLHLYEAAMCVTAKGRQLIGQVKDYIYNKYGGVQIYGDTDSAMIDLFIKEAREVCKWGVKLAKEINGTPEKLDDDGNVISPAIPGLFPKPLAMEFEKGMDIYIQKKKNYCYYLLDVDGTYKLDKAGNKIVMKKGLVSNRKTAPVIVNTHNNILYMILEKKSLSEAIKFLIDSIKSILSGQLPIQSFKLMKEIGGSYKADNFYLNIFKQSLAKQGKPVNAGDRLEYVIIDNGKKLLGEKMMLLSDYIDLFNKGEAPAIDYRYYIEKLMIKRINLLISSGFTKELEKYKDITHRRSNRCNLVGIDKIINLVCAYIDTDMDLDIIVEKMERVDRIYARTKKGKA